MMITSWTCDSRIPAEVISTKLLYAAGYHVPENYIAVIGREDLRIAPGATTHGPDGRKRPMTERDR